MGNTPYLYIEQNIAPVLIAPSRRRKIKLETNLKLEPITEHNLPFEQFINLSCWQHSSIIKERFTQHSDTEELRSAQIPVITCRVLRIGTHLSSVLMASHDTTSFVVIEYFFKPLELLEKTQSDRFLSVITTLVHACMHTKSCS